ncbi:MAG: OmpA family protein [Sulfitobacter sp.]
MPRNYLAVCRLAAALIGVATSSLGQQDVAGSRDHPLLSRYPDFSIVKYSSVAFDKADIMVGPAYVDSNGNRQLELKSVEGAVTNIKYISANSDVSTYALFSNYAKAFEGLGADVLFSCQGSEDCGMEGVFINNMINDQAAAFRGVLVDLPDDFAILTGVVSAGDRLAHIMVALGTHAGTGRRYVNQSITTSAILGDDQLGIGNLEDLTQALDDNGSVVLEGVLFDFDTATLKPESGDVLDILQQYMEAAPDVAVFIVGHSDNIGVYDYNVALSRERAEAVVTNLVGRGVRLSRMSAIGIGPVSPVARNDTTAGQALNRRVEMVVNSSRP